MKRKTFSIIISLILAVLFAFSGCGTNDPDIPGPSTSGATLSQTSLSLQEDESVTLTVRGADGTVTWSTSNEAIATVVNGVVTGVSDGTAFITAKVGDDELTCIVVVTETAQGVPTLYLDKSSGKVGIGFNLTLTPYVMVGNREISVDADDVTWTSSDTNVLTAENGVVTGKKEGSVTLSASYVYENTTLNASCTIEVVNYNYYKAYYNGKEVTESNPVLVKVADAYIGTTSTSSETVTVKEVDVLAGTEVDVASGVSLLSKTPAVATAEGLTLTGATLNGLTEVAIMLDGAEKGSLYVQGYAEITTKAHMDALGLATWKYRNDKATAQAILDGTYVLGNDIDYNKSYIIPIANAVNKYYNKTKHYEAAQSDCVDTFLWRDVLSDPSVTPAAEWTAIKFGTTESTFRTTNPHDLPFTGTFDGNGYEIKNGKMFFANGFIKEINGAWNGTDNYWTVSSGCVFGENAGTIKNVAFTDLQYSDTYYGNRVTSEETFAGHSRGANWSVKGPFPVKDNARNNAFCGFIYSNKGTISNVRVDAIALNLEASWGTENGFNCSIGALGVRYNWEDGVIENLIVNEKNTTFTVKGNDGTTVNAKTGISIPEFGIFGYNAGTIRNSALVANSPWGGTVGVDDDQYNCYCNLIHKGIDCANCNKGTVTNSQAFIDGHSSLLTSANYTALRNEFSSDIWNIATMTLRKGIN